MSISETSSIAPNPEHARQERKNNFLTVLGEFLTLLHQEYGADFPLWLYSSAAIMLLDQEEKITSAIPKDVDMKTTPEGVAKLWQFLKKYEDILQPKLLLENSAQDFEEKALTTFDQDVEKNSKKIAEASVTVTDFFLHLRVKIVYQDKPLELDIWSGVGDGQIALTRQDQDKTLIPGINIQDNSLTVSFDYVQEKQTHQQVVKILDPEALLAVYHYVAKLGKKYSVDKSTHQENIRRQETMGHIQRLKSISQ